VNRKAETDGLLLHTKHALKPNSLGYCGPDENQILLQHLYDSSTSDRLVSTLTRFEAAYPFVRMIAKATGRPAFDQKVTEAYWIGNSLLDKVSPSDFFRFAQHDLSSSRMRAGKNDGIKKQDTRSLFKELGTLAKPHHTFYVLGMYARSSIKSGSENKLLELMDSCRVSWGRVVQVKKTSLVVERPSLALNKDHLSLTQSKKKEIHYDPRIPPFSNIHRGDWVSVHWNFASEKLKQYQLKNLKRYTALDIKAANRLVDSGTQALW
jgi:hypothetical protein